MAEPALVIGEALTDVLVGPDGRRRGLPGGSPANVALGLGRLGHPVRFATRIGRDSFGSLLGERLRAGGVELAPGSVDDAPTSTATAQLDAGGSATYAFDIDWRLPALTAQAVRTGPPAHLHTGSIAAALAPGAGTVLELVEAARGAATVSYDPNLRPALLGPPEDERARIERLVAASDVVKASDEDLDWLYPGQDPAESAARWAEEGRSRDRGPALVVLTMGARGARAWWRHGTVAVPAPRITVADTVGAGDAFTSGLLSGLLTAGLLGAGAAARAALAAATSGPGIAAPVLDALTQAAVAAALTCTREGADPPTAAELAAARPAAAAQRPDA
jgi:fructokinase